VLLSYCVWVCPINNKVLIHAEDILSNWYHSSQSFIRNMSRSLWHQTAKPQILRWSKNSRMRTSCATLKYKQNEPEKYHRPPTSCSAAPFISPSCTKSKQRHLEGHTFLYYAQLVLVGDYFNNVCTMQCREVNLCNQIYMHKICSSEVHQFPACFGTSSGCPVSRH